MDLVLWLVPGTVAGLLAARFLRTSRPGMLGDVGVGMIGAVFGGWLSIALGIQLPHSSLTGSVAAGFTGAAVLLLTTRVLRLPGLRRFQ